MHSHRMQQQLHAPNRAYLVEVAEVQRAALALLRRLIAGQGAQDAHVHLVQQAAGHTGRHCCAQVLRGRVRTGVWGWVGSVRSAWPQDGRQGGRCSV